MKVDQITNVNQQKGVEGSARGLLHRTNNRHLSSIFWKVGGAGLEWGGGST